jgi:hypothetical protein
MRLGIQGRRDTIGCPAFAITKSLFPRVSDKQAANHLIMASPILPLERMLVPKK